MLFINVCCSCLVAQSCPTLCNPIDYSPPDPSIHGILQARTLEWVAISFSKSNYRRKESEVIQSCLTLCDPMDCSLPGSSIHGIFQAGVLEWVAISFSRYLKYPNGIKRCLLLGRKVMTSLDSMLKSRDITLPKKVHLVNAMVFPVVMYGCESWTVKKAEH